MAYTKAGSKAVDKYVRENYDRFQLKMKKGIKETAKAHAESKGMSLNAYINNLIEKDMKDANQRPFYFQLFQKDQKAGVKAVPFSQAQGN